MTLKELAKIQERWGDFFIDGYGNPAKAQADFATLLAHAKELRQVLRDILTADAPSETRVRAWRDAQELLGME